MEAETPLSTCLETSRRVQPYDGLFTLGSQKGAVKLPTLILTVLFVGLRLLTSGTNNIALPMVGLLLIVLLMYSNPTWGFVLTLYDMCLLAEQVGVESWQVYDLFRFRDLEFLVLIAIGIQMGALSFGGQSFAKLTKPIKYYLIIIGVTVIYSAIAYDFRGALRVSRILFFVSLVFVMPVFCKDQDDLKRLLRYVFILVTLSTLIDFTGFAIGNPAIMTPFNRNLDEAGKIWAGLGGVFRVYGGIGYAGYPVPFNYLAIFSLVAIMVVGRLRPLFWIVIVGLAILLEILIISKSSIGGLVLGLGIIVLLGGTHKTPRRHTALLRKSFLWIALSSWVLSLTLISVPFMAGSSVSKEYTTRFIDLFEQVQGNREGTFTLRVAYFQTVTEVMSYAGGNILTGMGYRLLPTEYGLRFRIAPFYLSQFQESGQLIGTTSLDSGWANVFWSLGVAGVIFFTWLIGYYLRASLNVFRSTNDVIARSLSLSLFAFFIVYPFLFFGMHLIYGKSVQQIIQFVLLVGTLGLWLDYSVGKAGQRTTGAIGL